jgi:hypothetical protein
MKFFAVQIIALLATGALAFPSQLEASQLEVRDSLPECTNTVPACNGGQKVKDFGTNCRCSGMHPTNTKDNTCDIWVCPGTNHNVVSLLTLSPFLLICPVFRSLQMGEYAIHLLMNVLYFLGCLWCRWHWMHVDLSSEHLFGARGLERLVSMGSSDHVLSIVFLIMS